MRLFLIRPACSGVVEDGSIDYVPDEVVDADLLIANLSEIAAMLNGGICWTNFVVSDSGSIAESALIDYESVAPSNWMEPERHSHDGFNSSRLYTGSVNSVTITDTGVYYPQGAYLYPSTTRTQILIPGEGSIGVAYTYDSARRFAVPYDDLRWSLNFATASYYMIASFYIPQIESLANETDRYNLVECLVGYYANGNADFGTVSMGVGTTLDRYLHYLIGHLVT